MTDKAILPGATIGILGSGQLGRMLALEAQRMGYHTHVYSPGQNTPAGQVADQETAALYDDLDAVRRFARQVNVVTYEFENVPAATAVAAAELVPLRPGPQALHVAQNRQREKDFCAAQGLPLTRYTAVSSLEELLAGLEQLGCPAILKTSVSGYDGKGQERIDQPGEATIAWEAIGQRTAVLEAVVDFERELSVVGARSTAGAFSSYGPIENRHRHHILDISVAPAAVEKATVREAIDIARCIAESLEIVGVFCVELFLQADGRLLVNEIAPRPHNSGHYTIDACLTNQFEQQLRAVCGLSLGDPLQWRPSAMANLLGDLWQYGEPDWAALAAFAAVKLHLYGKHEARPGRKMGHLTAVVDDPQQAIDMVTAARRSLTEKPGFGNCVS